MLVANELQDVTAYGLRSDFLSPEMMPKATVELALTKNRKLLLACMLVAGFFYQIEYIHLFQPCIDNIFIYYFKLIYIPLIINPIIIINCTV